MVRIFTHARERPLIRDDVYWASKKNSLEVIELFSINKVSLV